MVEVEKDKKQQRKKHVKTRITASLELGMRCEAEIIAADYNGVAINIFNPGGEWVAQIQVNANMRDGVTLLHIDPATIKDTKTLITLIEPKVLIDWQGGNDE